MTGPHATRWAVAPGVEEARSLAQLVCRIRIVSTDGRLTCHTLGDVGVLKSVAAALLR
jgi:hypothetical protein